MSLRICTPHGVQVPSSRWKRTSVVKQTTWCTPFSVSYIGTGLLGSIFLSDFMGSPLVKLVRVRAINVAKRVARLFAFLQTATESVAEHGVSNV